MNNLGLLDVVVETPAEEKIIKVVGVGGGGGNAVSYMYERGGFDGVNFLLLNTDKQVLNHSSISHKVVLGEAMTRGRGAGNRPEVAREATLQSEEEIREALQEGDTEMVFITATMGGGTGTGAAPIVGRIAKDLNLLTVGVVSIPFRMEGEEKIIKALKGVEELRKNVDVLLVLNNEKLFEVAENLTFEEALKKSDETLCSAVQGISEIITRTGILNVDFADIKQVLANGGVAIINTGTASGENRVSEAVNKALTSPLLNNNNIEDASKILVVIYDTPQKRLRTDELGLLKSLFQRLNKRYDAITGYFQLEDNSLGEDELAITILASGFDYKNTRNSIQNILKPESQIQANSVLDDEEKRKEAERWEETIRQMYGNTQSFQRDITPVCLMISELDDDDILKEMEDIPSLKRKHKQIERLRNIRQPLTIHTPQGEVNNPSIPNETPIAPRVGQTISFG